MRPMSRGMLTIERLTAWRKIKSGPWKLALYSPFWGPGSRSKILTYYVYAPVSARWEGGSYKLASQQLRLLGRGSQDA